MQYLRNAPTVILSAAIISYTAILTYTTWVQYAAFQDPTFDMGVSIQICQTILRTGLPLETANWVSSNGTLSLNFFGIHFSPIRYLFAGAYAIYPSAATLLFVQAFFVALGSIPVYKLSHHMLKDQRTSLLVSGLYLLLPPTIMSSLYDVHEESIIPFALLSAYYFYTTRQYNKSVGFFILLGLIQESADALIFFAALQLMIFNLNDYRKLLLDHKLTKPTVIILSLLIAAPIAFILENRLIQTINPTAGFIATAPQAYAISPFNILNYVPQKAVYWTVLLTLSGFLPLVNRKALILVVPWFIVSVFGGNPNFSVFFFQYNFLVIPALIIGVIYGLEKLQLNPSTPTSLAHRLRIAPMDRRVPMILLIGYLLLTPFYPFLSPYLVPGPHIAQYYQPPTNSTALDRLFSFVPDNATVLASDFVFPHVVRGINSYPLLYFNNFTAGKIEQTIHLPNNFTPDYIAIVPADYNNTVKAISGFPTSYGLVGTVTAQYPVLTGFNTIQTQKIVVTLYQHGYTGPPKLTIPKCPVQC